MGFRNLLMRSGRAVLKVAQPLLEAAVPMSGLVVELATEIIDGCLDAREKAQLRLELEEMMRATHDEFRRELVGALADLHVQLEAEIASVRADHRADVERLDADLKRQHDKLEAFLEQMPAAARQASRQLGDSSATTVPDSVQQPEVFAAFLPEQAPRFRKGDRVPGRDEWTLVEQLGRGGYGEVWLVLNEDMGTKSAVKFFHDPVARRRLATAEFAALLKIVRAGGTDGVVEVKEAGLNQNPPWLQFEYAEGGELTAAFDEWKSLDKPARVRAVHATMIDLARTVGHFHGLGVIHRDLKPANILRRRLKGGGHKPVIGDFGISKVVPSESDAARRSTPDHSAHHTIRAYTEMYASPQQRRFLAADKRDDVFALAVIWHQLLRGDVQMPRPGGKRWERSLADLGVSADAVALLAACWDDEADERPADGLALTAALEALQPARRRRSAVPASSGRAPETRAAGRAPEARRSRAAGRDRRPAAARLHCPEGSVPEADRRGRQGESEGVGRLPRQAGRGRV